MSRQLKVVIIGGDSCLGGAISKFLLKRNFHVQRTSRRGQRSGTTLDLSHEPSLWPSIKADVAVFCAGITSIKACAKDKDAAAAVNYFGTVKLASRMAEQGIHVLFLSTNQVFDGKLPHRAHGSAVCPISEYGRQKALVEKEILGLGNKGTILRLTKVLTTDMPLLREWKNALKGGLNISSYTNLPIAPVSIDSVCEVVSCLVVNQEPGIFQFSASEDISYSDLAYRLGHWLGADSKLIEESEADPEEIGFAHIPLYATLDMSKEEKLLGVSCPHPEDALLSISI